MTIWFEKWHHSWCSVSFLKDRRSRWVEFVLFLGNDHFPWCIIGLHHCADRRGIPSSRWGRYNKVSLCGLNTFVPFHSDFFTIHSVLITWNKRIFIQPRNIDAVQCQIYWYQVKPSCSEVETREKITTDLQEKNTHHRWSWWYINDELYP